MQRTALMLGVMPKRQDISESHSRKGETQDQPRSVLSVYGDLMSDNHVVRRIAAWKNVPETVLHAVVREHGLAWLRVADRSLPVT